MPILARTELYPRLAASDVSRDGLDPNDPKSRNVETRLRTRRRPANEQTTTTGLMLHYFLTGSTASRRSRTRAGRGG